VVRRRNEQQNHDHSRDVAKQVETATTFADAFHATKSASKAALPSGEARQRLVLGIAAGRVLADDTCVYAARDMRVGLITPAI
jgi:hypothetical protein